MKSLLIGVLDEPGYILKESVVNCLRLSGSMVLLIMEHHGIIFDRDFTAVKTLSFEDQ